MALPLVLVVSDDSSLREEAAYAFPSEVEVVTIDNALAATMAMNERIPSVVISQIRTGHEGGFSLARHMSQHTALRGVPIFMLLERPQDEWLAGQAGATAWRTRPIDTSELVRITMELLDEGSSVGSRSG
ncbi:MAG: response regulator [Actinomycetota bacterium]